VVPDPVKVAREMLRVCRPAGRIVLLNHFDRSNGSSHPIDRFLGGLASRVGVNWHVELPSFLKDAGLTAWSVERVNVPPVSSVVVCYKR
ncbi:MAG TPA: hypothetical protein VNU19_15620, partial [Candidatus Acidoferrum sp.]|nr:hypothetical protein [Candidatus Acidoferrum sp.]